MIRRILNLYRFTYSEQKSLAFLCFLLLLINSIIFITRESSETEFPLPQVNETSEISINTNNAESGVKTTFTKSQNKQISKRVLIGINKADSLAFLSLYGIGPVFASRIIKYRKLLGGFYNCNQLLEVYGMDTIRYQGFKNNIYVDTIMLKQLNINTSGFKELLSHPYLDYDAVKLLVQYRDKEGPISTPIELWRDSVLSENLQDKLIPYLKCR